MNDNDYIELFIAQHKSEDKIAERISVWFKEIGFSSFNDSSITFFCINENHDIICW